MSKARITGVRIADENHVVTTTEGGRRGLYRRSPCPICPWRCDAVGEFPAEAFRISAPTSYDMSGRVFACHDSGVEKPAVCAGFLLHGSDHNMAVRLHLMRGDVDLDQVSDGGHDLFHSYRAMAIANGVDPRDPVLRQCRANQE